MNKRIILSGGMLVFMAAIVAGGTGAFFSDTETSVGNVFTAGSVSIDLESITHEYYGDDNDIPANYFETGTAGTVPFFSFGDLKPGDTGEITSVLANGANDALFCARTVAVTGNDSDLADLLYFRVNTGNGLPAATTYQPLALGQWFSLDPADAANPGGGALEVAANTTTDLELEYCFGTFVNGTTGLAGCEVQNPGDPAVWNAAQNDEITLTTEYYAVQARNNGDFACGDLNAESTGPTPVVAASYATGFEPSAFATGNINGQDGWQMTGTLDSVVVDDPVIADTQSLRISNGLTTGNFGQQTFAQQLAVGAGETGIAPANRFEAEFEISSTELAEQPGLAISVSPDNGAGARMSYLGFADSAAGIDVTFYDVTNAGPLPTVSTFNPVSLGSLDRTTSHTIKFVMEFVDGPANDVVEIYINGTLVHTGTSWEDHFRFDPEQSGNGGQIVYPVNTLIFRAAGTAVPASLNGGYLFDNVVLTSSTI